MILFGDCLNSKYIYIFFFLGGGGGLEVSDIFFFWGGGGVNGRCWARAYV